MSTYINDETGARYNFVAPSIESDGKKEVIFPTAESVAPTISSNKAAVAVKREKTIIALGQLAADCEVTLSPDSGNLNIGAEVFIRWSSPASVYDVTAKVGATTIATKIGTASSASCLRLVWDGSALFEA